VLEAAIEADLADQPALSYVILKEQQLLITLYNDFRMQADCRMDIKTVLCPPPIGSISSR
jgi:hypothetical protein